VKCLHAGMTGGDSSMNKTAAQVQNRAYWIAWKGDVKSILSECAPCAQYHQGAPPRQLALQSMVVGEPWERLGVDITGPHPRSSTGKEYILTAVDHFTKWGEAFAIGNHKAPTVAKVLVEQIFTRFGTPMQILSDQGAEFEGKLMTELCTILEIDKIRTSPYRPQTNGATQRFHRTLKSMLGTVVAENQRDWDHHLPIVMAALRATIHESTGFLPNYLMFGREVCAPIDVILGAPPDKALSVDAFIAEYQQTFDRAYDLVRNNLRKAASRRKRYYDIGVHLKKFAVNTWVWYNTPRRYVGRSPKWRKNYTGPYWITRIIEPSNAVIQRSRRSLPLTVHIDKLKSCLGDTPTSWLNSCARPDNEDLGSVESPLNQVDVGAPDDDVDASPGQGSISFSSEDPPFAEENDVNVNVNGDDTVCEIASDYKQMRSRRPVKRPHYLTNYIC
jgi:transposase InsO family protein